MVEPEHGERVLLHKKPKRHWFSGFALTNTLVNVAYMYACMHTHIHTYISPALEVMR